MARRRNDNKNSGDSSDELIHLLKEKLGPLVVAKCGANLRGKTKSGKNEWSIWHTDVTCEKCVPRDKVVQQTLLADEDEWG